MEVLPIDLGQIIAITLSLTVILIPIAGLTARFALKPIVEAMALARGNRKSDAEVALLEKRIALLERQLELFTSARGLMAPDAVSNVHTGTALPAGTLPIKSDR